MHVVCSTVSRSVMNGIKMNEQKKSPDIGPLYLQTNLKRFDYSYLKVRAGFNQVGYRTLREIWNGVVYVVLQIGSP